MIDVVLLAGRLLLLALLYLFLFAVVKTGIGLVSSGRRAAVGAYSLTVTQGPRTLVGTTLPVSGPIIIGRSPGADIVVGDDFVSGRHARIFPSGTQAILEDLGSTNGTLVNGARVSAPRPLEPGDIIDVGSVRLRVGRT
ncbi:MAG: FHA domain-containing protein [Coriobacteriia bacterium]|nr:FHA domain-containing protein [Coriobacteriia bacterium]